MLNKKNSNYLLKTYKKHDKNSFIIEIDLDKYNEVFNEWDRSHIRKRDIHPELEEYLDSCSEDIPLKYKLVLYLYLPNKIKDEKKEKTIIEAIHNYYEYLLHFNQKKISEINSESLRHLIFSLILLILSFFMKLKIHNVLFNETLIEILYIGAWVLMWEAFHNTFLSTSNIRKKSKEYKRFLQSKIYFYYETRVNN
ncbi:hypothetical protein EV215_0205 [Hypnocyclicus thermotrophus]|uniref:Uncharacterized protein n=1 Tax=Hypnocyclicus thermotrophus TaxID=1627895 RepID=A0AA46I6H6_9FUSO|nr:hypothetical protein [Hypnocyclicus thermotrophus]TDT72401.1 hypothetical protein EV215_0205 [Hypnocyclicus thermotrophus]